MDPYDDNDIFNPAIGGGPVVISHTPSEEEKLYHELIGKYQGSLGESGTTTENVMWESVNAVLQELVNKGHAHYSRFMITPTKLGPRDFVNFGSFRSQLMSALQRMSQDFDLADPSYLIYEHMPKSGAQISNHAVASPIQNINQSQNQQQSQEVELSIDQRISLIEQELEEKLTDEQLKTVRPVLDEFKAEPTKWSKASKLIGVLLGLSKDVAVGVISNILSSQIGIPKI
ncbi:MAG: hypothetical protein Q8P10_01080 [bacterium]|nr:hypothetical protein [bacterium]